MPAGAAVAPATPVVCVTGQYRETLRQALDTFFLGDDVASQIIRRSDANFIPFQVEVKRHQRSIRLVATTLLCWQPASASGIAPRYTISILDEGWRGIVLMGK